MSDFDSVLYNGVEYKISGKTFQPGIVFVSNASYDDDDGKWGAIVMWIYDATTYNPYAWLGYFFYNKITGSVDKNALFDQMVPHCDPSKRDSLFKSFVGDTMTILCMIARYYNVETVSLQDQSKNKDGCAQCNFAFTKPDYVNSYGRYGFIETDIDLETLKIKKRLKVPDAVKKGNNQITAHKLKSKEMFDEKRTNEELITAYFSFKRNGGDDPGIPLPCTGMMSRIIGTDDSLHTPGYWVAFQPPPNPNPGNISGRYVMEEMPLTVLFRAPTLIIAPKQGPEVLNKRKR